MSKRTTPYKRLKVEPPLKRAKWTDEQTRLLIQEANAGQVIQEIQKLFPSYTKQQIYSKISVLKQQGRLRLDTKKPTLFPEEGTKPLFVSNFGSNENSGCLSF